MSENFCGTAKPLRTPIFLPPASPLWIDFQSVGFKPSAFGLTKMYPSRTLGMGTSFTAASPLPVQMMALLDDILGLKVEQIDGGLEAGDEVTGASIEIFRTGLGVSPLVGCDAIHRPMNLQCLKVTAITNLLLFLHSVVRLQIQPILSAGSSAPHLLTLHICNPLKISMVWITFGTNAVSDLWL